MACEVFKIVNNIAPSFIQKLIMLKCSQYSMRKDNPAVVPKANTDLKIICSWWAPDLEQPAKYCKALIYSLDLFIFMF